MNIKINKILVLLFFFLTTIILAQKGNQVKLLYGLSEGVYYTKNSFDGEITGVGKLLGVSEFGFLYNMKIAKYFRLESGFQYFSSSVIYTPSMPPSCGTIIESKEKLQLLSIPINLIIELGRYFYINGGLLVDNHINKNIILKSQSGLGFLFGVGGKYDYKDFSFHLNPVIKKHRLVGFKKEIIPSSLVQVSLRVGVGYTF